MHLLLYSFMFAYSIPLCQIGRGSFSISSLRFRSSCINSSNFSTRSESSSTEYVPASFFVLEMYGLVSSILQSFLSMVIYPIFLPNILKYSNTNGFLMLNTIIFVFALVAALGLVTITLNAIPITYAQVIESPSQEAKPLFKLFVDNPKPDHDYRLCTGTVGKVISNFGCQAAAGNFLVDEGYEWGLTLTGDVTNTMLYGCVISDTEKQVSCNLTSMPQKGQDTQLFIDWSQPSAMDMPPTFRTYESDAGDLVREINSKEEGNDND